MAEDTQKRAQVLLVEDNLTDATLIRTILEREGDIKVTLAQDGIRGCQLVESHRWNLVVTDFNLPGRDGIEVILACKTHQPDTPIISTSAYTDPTYREVALRGGASRALVKPIDGQELIQTARELLRMQDEVRAGARTILAIGTFPGDVEAGCGGILMKYGLGGDQVHVLVLSLGTTGADAEDQILAARKAARVMGAKLHIPGEEVVEVPDMDTALIRIKDGVQALNPDLVLVPSLNDVREARKHVNTAAEIATRSDKSVLCYQAATTTLDFRPNLFEDISDFLDQKMAALSHYLPQVKGRPHLDPDLSRAAARYWGRFLGYGEVEPFEVMRHTL